MKDAPVQHCVGIADLLGREGAVLSLPRSDGSTLLLQGELILGGGGCVAVEGDRERLTRVRGW